jgi:hypothetical protein
MVVIVEYNVVMFAHVFDIQLLVLLLDRFYSILFQLMHVIDLNDLIHFVNLLVENEGIRDLYHRNIRQIINVNIPRVQYEDARE